MNDQLLDYLYNNIIDNTGISFDDFANDMQDPAMQRHIFDLMDTDAEFGEFQADLGASVPLDGVPAEAPKRDMGILNDTYIGNILGEGLDVIENAAKYGWQQGASLSENINAMTEGADISDEEIAELFRHKELLENIRKSSSTEDFVKEGKIDGIGGFSKLLAETLIESGSSLLRGVVDSFQDVESGIAQGSALAATIASGGALAPLALGVTSAMLEGGGKFMEAMEAEALAKGLPFNEDSYREVVEDPEALARALKKGTLKGGVVGLFDAFAGFGAARVGAKGVKKLATISSKSAKAKEIAKIGAKGFAVEGGGGFAGEVGGTYAADREIGIETIREGLLEIIGEGPSAVITTGTGMARARLAGDPIVADVEDSRPGQAIEAKIANNPIKYQRVMSDMAVNGVTEESLKSNLDAHMEVGTIGQKTYDEMLQDFPAYQAANGSIPAEFSDPVKRSAGVDKIVQRNNLKQLRDAEVNKQVDEAFQDHKDKRVADLDDQINKLNNEINSIVDGSRTTQELTNDRDDTKTGQQNAEFFTEKAANASSNIPYVPVIPIDHDTPVGKAYDTFSAGGNFTGHISKMIAGFAEKQKQVAEAIVSGDFKRFLDIGTSEGGMIKTVASVKPSMEAVGVDPNVQMKANYDSTPDVPNAEFRLEALGAHWVEPDGTIINEFKPSEKFDVVNEDFTFQFINNDREAQVTAVKDVMTDDGLFITSEKFHTANFDANEAKKLDHQRKYFDESEINADQEGIVTGMAKDMVNDLDYVNTLKKHFAHVEEFWNAGNFKGYLASNNQEVISKFKADVGNLDTEFTDHGSLTRTAEDGRVSINEFRSEDTIEEALQQPGYVIVTASKEGADKKVDIEASKPENERLKAELESEFGAHNVQEVDGRYRGVDQGASFLVTNITEERGLEIGRANGQESIVTNKGIVMSETGDYYPNLGNVLVGEEAANADFHSIIKDVNGKPLAFSMDIDQTLVEAQPEPQVGDFVATTSFGDVDVIYDSPTKKVPEVVDTLIEDLQDEVAALTDTIEKSVQADILSQRVSKNFRPRRKGKGAQLSKKEEKSIIKKTVEFVRELAQGLTIDETNALNDRIGQKVKEYTKKGGKWNKLFKNDKATLKRFGNAKDRHDPLVGHLLEEVIELNEQLKRPTSKSEFINELGDVFGQLHVLGLDTGVQTPKTIVAADVVAEPIPIDTNTRTNPDLLASDKALENLSRKTIKSLSNWDTDAKQRTALGKARRRFVSDLDDGKSLGVSITNFRRKVGRPLTIRDFPKQMPKDLKQQLVRLSKDRRAILDEMAEAKAVNSVLPNRMRIDNNIFRLVERDGKNIYVDEVGQPASETQSRKLMATGTQSVIIRSQRQTKVTVDQINQQVANIKDALAEIRPNLTVEVLSNDEFATRTGQAPDATTKGNLRGDTLLINKDKATSTTVFHEGAHAAMLGLAKVGDPGVTAIHQAISSVLKRKGSTARSKALANELDQFVKGYKNSKKIPDLKAHEFFAELVGFLGANREQISKPTIRKRIIKAINNAIEKLIKVRPLKEAANVDEIIDFVNTLSGNLADGVAIKANIAPSVLGKGTIRNKVSPAEFNQATDIFKGVINKIGLSKTGNKGAVLTNKDLVEGLNKYYTNNFPSFKRNDFSAEAKAKYVEYGFDEVIFAMSKWKDSSGVGWYTEDYQSSLDILAQTHPEYSEENVRSAATMMIAITSAAQGVKSNFNLMPPLVDSFVKTGRFDSSLAPMVKANIEKMNTLLSQFDNDIFAVRDYLIEPIPVSQSLADAKRRGIKSNPEWPGQTPRIDGVDMILPRSVSVFGPKIGAFYSNLSGSVGMPTIDRWFLRTAFRYSGDVGAYKNPKQIDSFRKSNKLGNVSNGTVMSLAQEHAIVFNAIGKDKSLTPAAKTKAQKPYKAGAEVWNNNFSVIDSLNKQQTGLESKDQRAFRKFWLEVMEGIQTKLGIEDGIEITIPDIQAVLWLLEKRLYGHMGVKQKPDSTYSSAAQDYNVGVDVDQPVVTKETAFGETHVEEMSNVVGGLNNTALNQNAEEITGVDQMILDLHNALPSLSVAEKVDILNSGGMNITESQFNQIIGTTTVSVPTTPAAKKPAPVAKKPAPAPKKPTYKTGNLQPQQLSQAKLNDLRAMINLKEMKATKETVDAWVADAYENNVSNDGSYMKEFAIAIDALEGIALDPSQQISLAYAISRMKESLGWAKGALLDAKAQDNTTEMRTYQARIFEIENDLDLLTRAGHRAGSTAGRALAVRKELFDFKAYNAQNMRAKLTEQYERFGKKPTPADLQAISTLAAKIEARQSEIDRLSQRKNKKADVIKKNIAETEVAKLSKKGKAKKKTLTKKVKRSKNLSAALDQLNKVIKGDIC